MGFLQANGLRLLLAMGAFFAGLEEMLEAFFVSFEGICELHHAVLFLSAIHVLHAIEAFFDAHQRTKGTASE